MTTTKSNTVVHIDFANALGILSERPERYQTTRAVLAALKADGRMSVFDATSTQKIARAVDRLEKAGAVVLATDGFPWLRVRVTELGEAILAKSSPRDGLVTAVKGERERS